MQKYEEWWFIPASLIEKPLKEGKALSTLMPFQKERVFVVIENASIDSRPHYRFGAFSTVQT